MVPSNIQSFIIIVPLKLLWGTQRLNSHRFGTTQSWRSEKATWKEKEASWFWDVLGMEHMDMFSGRKNKLGNKGNHQHWQERKGIRNKRESGKRWMWYVVSRRGRNKEMKRFQVKPTWEAIKRNMKPSQLIKYNQIVMICFQNPPTPAVSRGSASEEALLATRCQKGRRVCAERKPAPGGHEQGGSWQCRNAGKVKVWS